MPNPTSVTLSVDEATLAKMEGFYAENLESVDNPNLAFFARLDKVVISAYKKVKNGFHKVLFQGEKAAYEASIWGIPEAKKEPPQPTMSLRPYYPQIGSDEVGTGDFFGPITVAAAYVPADAASFLSMLGVTDSKALTDERIRSLGPTLIQKIPYSQLCLPNDKYNALVQRGLNMNAIKAKMHNRCLLNLKEEFPDATLYVDQFAVPKTYYSYLEDEEEIASNIFFATKGETKFISVATASIIARYSFLRHMDLLGEKYGVSFPFGAGPKVDEFAAEFLKKHGEEEFLNVAKTNFANMKRLPR